MTPVADAVAEAPQLVSAVDSHVLYTSRRDNLRLVKRSTVQLRSPEGNTGETIQGETVEFMDGQLRVPKEGPMRLKNGLEVDGAEVAEWLSKHHLLNDKFEGFWLVHATAPAPSTAELQTLSDLTLRLDDEGLAEFIKQEKDGWAREQLLEPAELTLERMLELKKTQEAKVQGAIDAARKEGEEAAKGAGK